MDETCMIRSCGDQHKACKMVDLDLLNPLTKTCPEEQSRGTVYISPDLEQWSN